MSDKSEPNLYLKLNPFFPIDEIVPKLGSNNARIGISMSNTNDQSDFRWFESHEINGKVWKNQKPMHQVNVPKIGSAFSYQDIATLVHNLREIPLVCSGNPTDEGSDMSKEAFIAAIIESKNGTLLMIDLAGNDLSDWNKPRQLPTKLVVKDTTIHLVFDQTSETLIDRCRNGKYKVTCKIFKTTNEKNYLEFSFELNKYTYYDWDDHSVPRYGFNNWFIETIIDMELPKCDCMFMHCGAGSGRTMTAMGCIVARFLPYPTECIRNYLRCFVQGAIPSDKQFPWFNTNSESFRKKEEDLYSYED